MVYNYSILIKGDKMKDESFGGFYYIGVLIGISSLVYSILILYCGYTENDYLRWKHDWCNT